MYDRLAGGTSGQCPELARDKSAAGSGDCRVPSRVETCPAPSIMAASVARERPLRILFDIVETTLPGWGGMQEHVVILGRHLAANGCQPFLVERARFPAEVRRRIASANIQTVSRHGLEARNGARPPVWRWAWALASVLRQIRPDVYHIHTALTGDEYYAAAVARIVGVPALICTYHTPIRSETRRRQVAMRAMHRLLGVRGIAVSTNVMDSVQRRYDPPPGYLVRVTNGVEDVPTLVPEPVRPMGAVIVGVIARLVPEKGVDVLLEAIAQVAPALPVRAVIVGDGEALAALRSLARERGVADRVEFRGWIHDAARLLTEFDIVAIPSRWSEAFPLVAAEACAAGRPIIATASGGLPDIVHDGQNGRLVPVDDARAMAQAIGSLVQDPDLRRRMGQNARRYFEAELQAEGMTKRTLAVYRDRLSSTPDRQHLRRNPL